MLKKLIRKLFLYVNNRLEGNALLTIVAMLEEIEEEASQFFDCFGQS